MRKLLLAVYVGAILGLTAPALAGSHDPAESKFDAGFAAFDRGDYKTAIREWTPLAEQGDADAQYALGVLHFHFKLSENEAVKWLHKAAEKGHPLAQYNLGASYYFGSGVPQDFALAAKWFRLAASAGVPMAQFNLGEMYRNGAGVPQDLSLAAKLFLRSAEQSVETAFRNIGLGVESGGVIPPPNAQVYREAIKQALAASKISLGLMYADGLGIQRDYVQAYMWVTLANRQGHANASRLLKELAKFMTPAKIAGAEKLAREWKPKK